MHTLLNITANSPRHLPNISELDVLLLGCIFPRFCSVTAKSSLRHVPFLGWFSMSCLTTNHLTVPLTFRLTQCPSQTQSSLTAPTERPRSPPSTPPLPRCAPSASRSSSFPKGPAAMPSSRVCSRSRRAAFILRSRRRFRSWRLCVAVIAIVLGGGW